MFGHLPGPSSHEKLYLNDYLKSINDFILRGKKEHFTRAFKLDGCANARNERIKMGEKYHKPQGIPLNSVITANMFSHKHRNGFILFFSFFAHSPRIAHRN